MSESGLIAHVDTSRIGRERLATLPCQPGTATHLWHWPYLAHLSK